MKLWKRNEVSRLSRRLVRDLRLGRYVRQYQGAAGGFLGSGDSRGEIRARMGRAVGMGNECGAAGVRALPNAVPLPGQAAAGTVRPS